MKIVFYFKRQRESKSEYLLSADYSTNAYHSQDQSLRPGLPCWSPMWETATHPLWSHHLLHRRMYVCSRELKWTCRWDLVLVLSYGMQMSQVAV